MFCFRKKKKNTAKIFMILGIVIGVAAAAVGGYFLFTKFLKDKLCKKKSCEETCEEIVDDACDCCEETCDACEEIEAIEEIPEDVEE